ncbi:MAG: sugar ABC transporter ATP-binding protein [Ruminococcus bromii]|nr:sugar ABC transporter ATP-binding protein [Ruminococcus bromii]
MENILVLDKINKYFPGVHALKDMSLSIREGEVQAICGENGAGKSTLMKVVTGVYKQESGDVIFKGEKINITNPNQAYEMGIAIMYQETSLFAEMTILENLFLNHEITKRVCGVKVLDYPAMRAKATEIFKSLSTKMNLDTKVKNISMAQKQMVEIAKALTFNTKVLIMDEPTASLTETEVNALFDIIRNLKAKGVSIVYISHRMEEIFEVCDRVTVIRDGQFVATHDIKDTNKDMLVAEMVGRTVSSYYPKQEVEIGDVCLQIEDLCQDKLLHHVSLTVHKGEIVGLSGLVGAGRTELAHAVCGFTQPDSGKVIIDGKEAAITDYISAMDHGIVYVSEDRGRYGLVTKMDIKQNVTLPQIRKVVKKGRIDTAREKEMGATAISTFDIKAPSADVIVENLSGGNQQKVSVAKAVALNPKVMILDEPTRGVDVNAKAEIHRIVGNLVKDGLAVLMISSELPELLGMCDRIYVMNSGHIMGEFDRAHATQQNILELELEDVSSDD